jgi:hypothetical protein
MMGELQGEKVKTGTAAHLHALWNAQHLVAPLQPRLGVIMTVTDLPLYVKQILISLAVNG